MGLSFQGKQAEGVILCLGLDNKKEGAARWASQKPNLLNVAITRAKYRFIAVGDKDIWLKQSYFNQLKELPLFNSYDEYQAVALHKFTTPETAPIGNT